jgi:hypothetical protein
LGLTSLPRNSCIVSVGWFQQACIRGVHPFYNGHAFAKSEETGYTETGKGNKRMRTAL